MRKCSSSLNVRLLTYCSVSSITAWTVIVWHLEENPLESLAASVHRGLVDSAFRVGPGKTGELKQNNSITRFIILQ